MSAPQPTAVLVKRLLRVAKWLDAQAEHSCAEPAFIAATRARANTCYQAAGRLEEQAAKEKQ